MFEGFGYAEGSGVRGNVDEGLGGGAVGEEKPPCDERGHGEKAKKQGQKDLTKGAGTFAAGFPSGHTGSGFILRKEGGAAVPPAVQWTEMGVEKCARKRFLHG